MTNSHEPSYYEIALTNRQVVVAFVILLICLVSAFFSGLWIGRESAARAQGQMARNAPLETAEPEEGQALEEFRFFEDDQKPAGAGSQGAPGAQTADPVETVSPDTTLVEDFGGADDDAADGDASEEEVEPAAPAVVPVTATPKPTPAMATPTPKPTPAPAQPRTPANTPRNTPAEPRLAAGQVVIQVFSTADLPQAESVQGRLSKGGHKAYLSPVQVGGRTMYRVRIGPFDSRSAAQTVAEQVRKGYKLDTWVTE